MTGDTGDIHPIKKTVFWLVLLMLLLTLGTSRARDLLARIYLNKGAIVCIQGATPGPRSQSAILNAVQSFQTALRIDSRSVEARWRLGHAFVRLGDYSAAVQVLDPLVVEGQSHPLIYADLLNAFSLAGLHGDVIELYEGLRPPGIENSKALNDKVALAYLERARRALFRSNQQEAIGCIRKASALRPNDLFANYHLWRESHRLNRPKEEAQTKDELMHFSLDSIDPNEGRLLPYVTQVIPELLQQGVWERDQAVRSVAFLVWRCYSSPEVLKLMETLHDSYPSEADWLFYLGELYHRRQSFERAWMSYRETISVDRDYAAAYLRLGMVTRELSVSTSNARVPATVSKWYEEYQRLMPDDVLALRSLAQSCQPFHEWDEYVLGKLTNERTVIASLLDMPEERIRLGSNLIDNGGFEDWITDAPDHWMPYHQPESHSSWTLSASGPECLGALHGDRSARILGLWMKNSEQAPIVRTGYWYRRVNTGDDQPVILKAGRTYVLAFLYRASRGVQVWLTPASGVMFGGDYSLPATNGETWRVIMIGSNNLGRDAVVSPTVRLHGLGDLLIDDVRLQPLKFTTPLSKTDELHVWISGESR